MHRRHYAAGPSPLSSLRFGLPTAAEVHLSVFDVAGRLVATVIDGERMEPGIHEARLDTGRLGAGVYYARLASGVERVTRKLVSEWKSPDRRIPCKRHQADPY